MKSLFSRCFILGMLCIPMLAQADIAALNSRIDAKASQTPDHKVTFNFKVIPLNNNVINHDGPWSLQIESAPHLSFAKNKLSKADFQEKLPGFTLTSSSVAKGHGELKYKLISFVCTKNKEQCFRDVHRHSVKW